MSHATNPKKSKGRGGAGVPEEKRFLTAKQVAELLNASVRSVWSWRASGRLKAVKVGPKATRFRPEDVDKLIQKGLRDA